MQSKERRRKVLVHGIISLNSLDGQEKYFLRHFRSSFSKDRFYPRLYGMLTDR
jgi:hypothetical protein